jgi:hypothetical protein
VSALQNCDAVCVLLQAMEIPSSWMCAYFRFQEIRFSLSQDYLLAYDFDFIFVHTDQSIILLLICHSLDMQVSFII